MKKEGNSEIFFYNLSNSLLIPSFYNSLTFMYFQFTLYHKPDLFSPPFFLFNNFCLCVSLFVFFLNLLNSPFLLVCLLIRHFPIVPLSLEFIQTLSPYFYSLLLDFDRQVPQPRHRAVRYKELHMPLFCNYFVYI